MLRSPVGAQPKRLTITDGKRRRQIWLYLWTVTPGGRPELPDEVRIQLTGVSPPLRVNPRGPTLLMGFDQRTRTFACFDAVRHINFAPGSPSVQATRRCLRDAARTGLGFHRKNTGEVVVGVRPDFLIHYVMHARGLHAARKRDLPVLLDAVSSDGSSRTARRGLSARLQGFIREVSGRGDSIENRAAGAALDVIEREHARARGQGFTSSPEHRKAVENHAMKRARAYLIKKGYNPLDTSLTKPYDYEARKGAAVYWVEVKGTTTSGDAIILTPNEVAWARKHRRRMVLFIVRQIRVKGRGKRLRSQGGTDHVIWPWSVKTRNLEPLSYSYRLA